MLENCNPNQHGPTMTAAEFRSQFSTFSILTSPLILGNDLRNMSAACLAIISNKDIIALNQDPLVARAKLVFQFPMKQWPNANRLPPLTAGDLGARAEASPVNSFVNITLQVWEKQLADGSVGVVAFNRGEHSVGFTITWDMLGIPAARAAAVNDLWMQSHNGTHVGSFRCPQIAPHDVCVVRVTPQTL